MVASSWRVKVQQWVFMIHPASHKGTLKFHRTGQELPNQMMAELPVTLPAAKKL
jgi:hypothetical protein